MVKEDVVLGHMIFKKGLEVDKAKIKVIEKLFPPLNNVNGVSRLLRHVRLYIRFIKDLTQISKPFCILFQNDLEFDLVEDCVAAFKTLKKDPIRAYVTLHLIEERHLK
jgi:hypothetical protein